MNSLSPTKRFKTTRLKPAVSPYQWLDRVQLSPDELGQLREHVERTLQLHDGEVTR